MCKGCVQGTWCDATSVLTFCYLNILSTGLFEVVNCDVVYFGHFVVEELILKWDAEDQMMASGGKIIDGSQNTTHHILKKTIVYNSSIDNTADTDEHLYQNCISLLDMVSIF
ncbi:hypothetical protein NE237_008102 [Protea cynaroides]|uniref:Uncharacterized protein n=1 Tax=Protea cynaroides TaxID=273540 RepID=A0A9Q0KQC9_9MAGN|nr:hypothetical protein NE237_008102 [Protea cynaroides]